MVQIDTKESLDIVIQNSRFFDELLAQFVEGIKLGFILELPVTAPYLVKQEYGIKYYADRWFMVRETEYVWELKFPDFPTSGFIRNFKYGHYFERVCVQTSQRIYR